MKKQILIALAFVFVLSLLAASPALADAPTLVDTPTQPYHYALVQCSGMGLTELKAAQQRFDTWYGFAHVLTTDGQWVNSYEPRANEFAVMLGCKPVLQDGALTFWAKGYAVSFRFLLGDAPTPY